MFLKFLATILLLSNGIGAFYGSWHLILHPDGSSLNLSLSMLEHSPFSSFFIPGIVLFLVNGLLSFLTLTAIALNKKIFVPLLLLQGLLLFGWIAIQCIMLRTIATLHLIYGSIGLAFIIIGWYLYINRIEVIETIQQ